MTKANRLQRGFSLIELSISIFVIALLLGSILVPLATQVEQRQIGETQKTLDEIKEAVLGFASANGYLPCPDTDNDGLENIDAVAGKCTTVAGNIAAGNLPWSTLGLTSQNLASTADAWGNRFRYVLNERYAWRAPASTITLTGGGTDVRICTTAATCGSGNLVIAAVLSMGRNGYGATNSQTGAANVAPTSADELENVNSNRDIISRTASAVDAGAGEFDDIVVSISRFVLFNRMIAAAKLP